MIKRLPLIFLISCLIMSLAACGLSEGLLSVSSAAGRGTSPNTGVPRGEEAQRIEEEKRAEAHEAAVRRMYEEEIPPEEPLPGDLLEYENALVRLSSMSLKEKVCQLFVIAPENLSFDPATGKYRAGSSVALNDNMRAAWEGYPCAGICLFGANITAPDQLKKLTEDIHGLGGVKPFVCVDEEGGIVVHISNKTVFGIRPTPTMGSMARTGDPQTAYDAYLYIGGYLKEYGIDLDLAPIADVNTNPNNPIIGNRAFGGDPVLAAEMVARSCEALRGSGVSSCLKHFPGHGDTQTDTHTGYAQTGKTWEEMLGCEILPFKAGIKAGADFVMAAHIAAPNVTGDSIPASLSYTLLTEKLRRELGFGGVIITDALMMGAVSKAYSNKESVIRALEAGADLLLMPGNYYEAVNGILDAVGSGRLSEERVNASVMRILKAKENMGLL